MIEMQGEKEYVLPPEALWEKLTDLAFLVECVPDVSEVKEISAKSAHLTVRPGFSFVRGEMQMNIEKLEEQPLQMARFAFRTKGIGSSTEVEAQFHFQELPVGTHVRWHAEVKQLGGLLKAVPRGLIQAAAQRVVNDLLGRIEAKIAGQS